MKQEMSNEKALAVAKQYNDDKAKADAFNQEQRDKCYLEMSRYIVVAEGGKVRIQDILDWDRKWDEAQAAKRFGNVKILVRTVKLSKDNEVVTKLDSHLFYYQWLSNATRYDKVVFNPKLPFGPIQEKYGTWIFNRWNGFPYEAEDAGSCDLFYEFLLKRICDDKHKAFEYVLDWMAALFQEPWKKNNIALVFSSQEQGSGKSVFGGILIEMLKPYSMEVGIDELVGRFNDHLRNKLFIFVDENAFYQKRTVWNQLKKMVTSYTQTIEEKNMGLLTAENYIRLLFASNDEISVGLETSNRRYVTIKCREERMPKAERDALIAQLESGGYAKLMWDLYTRNIEGRDWTPPIFDSSYLNSTIEAMKTTHPAWIWLLHCAFDDIKNEHSCFYKESNTSGVVSYKMQEIYEELVSTLYKKYEDWSRSTGMFTVLDQHRFYMDIGSILDGSTNHAGGRKRNCSKAMIPETKMRLAKAILGSRELVHWLGVFSDLDEKVQKERLKHDEVIEKLSIDVLDAVKEKHLEVLQGLKESIETYIDLLKEYSQHQAEEVKQKLALENVELSVEEKKKHKEEYERVLDERERFMKAQAEEQERQRKRIEEVMGKLSGRGIKVAKKYSGPKMKVEDVLARLKKMDGLDGVKSEDEGPSVEKYDIRNIENDPSEPSDSFYHELIATLDKGEDKA